MEKRIVAGMLALVLVWVPGVQAEDIVAPAGSTAPAGVITDVIPIPTGMNPASVSPAPTIPPQMLVQSMALNTPAAPPMNQPVAPMMATPPIPPPPVTNPATMVPPVVPPAPATMVPPVMPPVPPMPAPVAPPVMPPGNADIRAGMEEELRGVENQITVIERVGVRSLPELMRLTDLRKRSAELRFQLEVTRIPPPTPQQGRAAFRTSLQRKIQANTTAIDQLRTWISNPVGIPQEELGRMQEARGRLLQERGNLQNQLDQLDRMPPQP